MYQLSISFQSDEGLLREYFEKAVKKKISLIITDNSSSMLSVKANGGLTSLRLHRIFLSAGEDVLHEIAEFLKNRKIRTPLIRRFINQNTHALRQKPPRRITLRTLGKYFDLVEIFNSVNSEYFGGRVAAAITWGTKNTRRVASRRTLGSYSSHSNLIRINPLLDRKRVPRYFMEFIVYHEMLHADIGIETGKGRRSVHSTEFKRREKLFRDYRTALKWEKTSL
jgi:hypothetical protein